MAKKPSARYSPSQKRFFEETYRCHLRKVQFYACNYLGNKSDAKSVAQDVFLALWENLDEIDTQMDILPYLIVVAKFKCMNILRNRSYQHKYIKDSEQRRDALAYEALNDFTSTHLYSGEIMELVCKSLEQMPETVKSTYILSREKNMKNNEIAEKLLISIKTVEYRISYALKILRKNLQDYNLLIVIAYFVIFF